MRVSRFDLDGRAAPAVLLHLRHPLAGHLVGVISGTHGDLVLDDALDFQLVAAAAANRRHGEPIKLQSSNSDRVPRAVALRRASRWLQAGLSQARYSPADCHMWKSPISWFRIFRTGSRVFGNPAAESSILELKTWSKKCICN